MQNYLHLGLNSLISETIIINSNDTRDCFRLMMTAAVVIVNEFENFTKGKHERIGKESPPGESVMFA